MAMRVPVPRLKNKNITIRLAENDRDVDTANELVCKNYMKKGYWESGKKKLLLDRYLESRRVVVVETEGRIIGTASIIKDSKAGLPADSFNPSLMAELRQTGDRLAEISALAVETEIARDRYVVLFLLKFVYQYGFYYTNLERFIVVANPKHVFFYKSVCCFTEVGEPSEYGYVSAPGQLLTLPLLEAHLRFQEKHELGAEAAETENFYRFFAVFSDASFRFPENRPASRSRNVDWASVARLAYTQVAV